MTLVAISLLILSASIHALWNLFTKKRHPTTSFFLVASLTGALLLSPVLIHHSDTLLHHVPNRVWMFLVIAGFLMALHFISLAKAYRAGDLSIAYPIARAMPVIIVLAVVVYLDRVDQISFLSIAGSALVVFGCFLIPFQRFNELRLSNYLNLTCGMALIAATCTAGYALVDDEALRYFRNNNQLAIDNTSMSILYAGLEAIITSLWLALFVVIRKKNRKDFYQVMCFNKWHAVIAGIGIHLSGTLILVALAFVENVSYVVAFHRLSIPLGVALGILVLKEKAYPLKLWGVLIMLIGVFGVALG